MAAVDMNRLSEGVSLSPKQSAAIWQDTLESSAIRALTPSIQMPGTGMSIQTITGDPEAEWVAETEEKPVGDSTFSTKIITPYKMAVIELFSEEFVRDANALYTAIRARLPYALGRLLDQTILYGTAPGSNFDVLSDAPEIQLGGPSNIADNILAINAAIAAAGHRLSGWGLSPQAEAALIGARGPQGELIFSQNFRDEISVGRILGREAYMSKALFGAGKGGGTPATDVVGLAGDWSQARLGIVSDIRLKATSEATVNKNGVQVNLWQRNMIGLLVEMEVGFVVNDKSAFVRLTQAAPTDPGNGDDGGGEGGDE